VNVSHWRGTIITGSERRQVLKPALVDLMPNSDLFLEADDK